MLMQIYGGQTKSIMVFSEAAYSLLAQFHNTPLLPPKNFCITIVCNFSWDMKMSQAKSKTMPMQIFGG